jgi:anthranilate synthase/aminodeoxychorismate synthase-like glutamine amidotransferase
MILVIDNYDSFTYNIVQYMLEMTEEVKVVRNDKTDLAGIAEINPAALVISPGPGRPESAGISLAVIREYADKIPVLGVSLGHQAVAQAFGGSIVKAKRVMHGKTSDISCDGDGIFRGFGNGTFKAMRYHSLIVDEASLPSCLIVSARADDGEIMGLRHKDYKLEGVQFHPESIMTTAGKRIIRNFINLVNESQDC